MPYGPFPHGWPYSNFHDLNLDWVIHVLQEAKAVVTEKIPEIKTAIYELQAADKDINARIDDVLKKIGELVDDNTIMQLVIQAIDCAIKMVFFGLSDDGYFVAFIPNSWDCITFGTILDCESPDYGKLTLSY